jgi:tRNA threonylcarbamoyladenosine biosynthesis protein TsaE
MDTIAPQTFRCTDITELDPVAAEILRLFPSDRIFTLSGPMGSGKTTLVKAFCRALGTTDAVSSPTFTIVNEYLSGTGEPVYHFDFYRINSISEVYDLGFEDYLYSGSYCFIEWPEAAAGLMPERTVHIALQVTDHTRTLTVSI